MTGQSSASAVRRLVIVLMILICASVMASAQFTTLYHFTEGDSGYGPEGGLVADKSGNLYGKTLWGGTGDGGTVFELSPPAGSGNWTETVLHSFGVGEFDSGCGCQLVFDRAGNLYGTDNIGAFGLTPPAVSGEPWTFTHIFEFPNGDAGDPSSGLVFDGAGNLYGVTYYGGQEGRGSVYELSPPTVAGGTWTQTVLHSFGDKTHGIGPTGNLVMIGKNLYGVTGVGGAANGGAVFKLAPPPEGGTQWNESVIYSFTGGTDGGSPNAGLTLRGNNLYGTTLYGGEGTACTTGCGVVFELSPPTSGGAWTETVLYSFLDDSDGMMPIAPVSFDSSGNLYASSGAGGGGNCDNGGVAGCGAVVQLVPPASGAGAWAETTLHTFSGTNTDQGSTVSGLIFGRGQKLYGTTLGSHIDAGGNGTVFEVVP
jgi:uncharacterized repeat protein (TIGR03803 family)